MEFAELIGDDDTVSRLHGPSQHRRIAPGSFPACLLDLLDPKDCVTLCVDGALDSKPQQGRSSAGLGPRTSTLLRGV